MRCKQVGAGEWVQPRKKNYYMQCCDCGLIHRMNFRIFKGKVQFQAFRASKPKARVSEGSTGNG